MATEKKQVLIRMRQNSYDKLKAIANKNRRTVTNQVEYLIEGFIEGYESQYGQITPDASGGIKNQQVGNSVSFVTGK